MFFPTSLCGVIVFVSVFRTSASASSSSRSFTQLCHTQLCHTPSATHTIFHTQPLSHTIFHTPLCHTPSFTRHFVTHHLSHAPLSHTIFHTPSLSHTIFHKPLCHTPSFAHNFCHTHTFFHTQVCHTPSFTHTLVLSDINFATVLGDIQLGFASQSWRLRHWAGCSGALGRCWSPRKRGTSRGRRGAWQHPPSLCVEIHFRFAWQVSYLWHWAGSGGALSHRSVAWGAVALRVAGVALGDIQRHFAWQAWHLARSTFVCVAGVVLVALGWAWWRA